MSNFKNQIEQHLKNNNWEISEIDSSDEWWDDEYWKIKPTKSNLDIEIVIVFKVDPHFEGNRKKGQGVIAIDALTRFPKHRTDTTSLVTALDMTKGKFNTKLEYFISALNQYKKQEVEKKGSLK